MKSIAEVIKVSYPKQRQGFKAMLLSNPNYFGNAFESEWEPIFPMCSNTFYEEMGCVGYHPQQEQLEAVVYVYQPSGYGTGVCGSGTPEFVRFYLSFDDGATWEDQGMASFQAFNIPEGTEGERRLEYAVSLKVDPPSKFCIHNPLIHVRAILSWNDPPPADQPDWLPVWGNVRQSTILVEPIRVAVLKEILELAKFKLPPYLKTVLDLETPMPIKKKALGAADLAALYGKKVPAHRFALKEYAAFTSGKIKLSAQAYLKLLPNIKIDPELIEQFALAMDGDTSFEELECIGLDPNTPDTLVGVLNVKKSLGYSGGPCTDGSREYVTFWADFDDNGTFEACLGTADVTVYDVEETPPEGVHYAVRLPVNLDPYRQACTAGPRLVRIRAILSWNVAAPCADPNHVPVWGNREETVIHISPGKGAPGGYIAILGGIPVAHIDDVTGLTTSGALFATNNLPPDALGRPCPFGGCVTAQGTSIPGYSYMVETSPDGLIWTPALKDLVVTDQYGNTGVHQADPVTHHFAYLPFEQNVNGLLAQCDSAGDDLWYIRLVVFDGGGAQQGAPDVHRIQLDNTHPTVSIAMAPGTPSCGKFTIGTTLNGTFVARDEYLGSYALWVAPPINPPGVGVPNPSSGNTQTAMAPGDAWDLDTSNMLSCGYVLHLRVIDRAIINSQRVGHRKGSSIGFCLE